MNLKSIIEIIGLLSIIILINGCKKEPNNLCESETEFIIGLDNCFVEISTLDSTISIIALPNQSTHNYFDIEKDGIPDFELHSQHIMSPGGINEQKSYIKTLNSSYQISTIERPDTFYRCMNIGIDSVITFTNFNNYSNYTCNGIDTLYNISKHYSPSINSLGDSLNQNQTWSSNDLILSYFDQASGLAPY